ncbi:MAG: hypothetical protein MJ080_04775, partial [Clostridia bacterium]|nr:hypothetical protein [Clostridia bacterium]
LLQGDFSSDNAKTLQVGAQNADAQVITIDIKSMSAGSLGINSVDVTTQSSAKSAIDLVKSSAVLEEKALDDKKETAAKKPAAKKTTSTKSTTAKKPAAKTTTAKKTTTTTKKAATKKTADK